MPPNLADELAEMLLQVRGEIVNKVPDFEHLHALQKLLAEYETEAKRQRNAALLEAMLVTAREAGFSSILEMMEAVTGRPPAPPAPKRIIKPLYRDSDGNTWTGRGRPPRWLQAKIDAGESKDDYRI